MTRYQSHHHDTPTDYQLQQLQASSPYDSRQIYLKQNAANQFREFHSPTNINSSGSHEQLAYQQQQQAQRQFRQLPSAPTTHPVSYPQSNNRKHPSTPTTTSGRLTRKLSALRLATLCLLLLDTVLISTAFFSSNWLEAEHRYYGSKFRRLGLWRFCFNSFSAKDDIVFKKFYVGCRWILADDYKSIRSFLLPTFFIATQLFYTAGFLLLVLICAGIIAVQQCFIIEREDHALRLLSIASLLSSASCSLGVLIFALNANGEDWMPDPQHNYFSWSFAAALIGSLLLWIVALLFYIEMRLVIKKNLRTART